MNFLISDAWADGVVAAGQQQGPVMSNVVFMAVIAVLFYFMLIRPQAKRAKEHKNMVAALSKGDEVVTNGGMLGRITEVSESFITINIADGVDVKVQRQSIMTLVPKGTIKGE